MNIIEVYNQIHTSNTYSVNQNLNQSSENTDFASYMNSPDNLEPIFQKASETYGVSVQLLKAMAKQESNFNPNATSSSGAQGVMQLMPATAAELGVTNAYDPEQNIMGGAKYIRKMLDKYDGNVSLALAAYNAGSGNVDKYGGIPPFEETQNYVAKITGYLGEDITLPEQNRKITADELLDYMKNMDAEDETLQSILNELFSYEDYMKFLELFMDELRVAEAQTYYSYESQSFHPTILNLREQM